jgi:DNA gyrase/topoisomerase IV subunit A
MTIDLKDMQAKVTASVAHKAQNKEHWFFSGFFKTLLINCCLNILIWGGVIAALPFFGPQIEQFLFPSVKQIQKMRNELDRAAIIEQEKSKELTSLSEQTRHELSGLKETLQILKNELKTVRDDVSSLRLQQVMSESTEIGGLWKAVLKQFGRGESFEEQLHALDPFIAENKDVLVAVRDLVTVSSQKTVPFNTLKHNLLMIKENITGEKTAESSVASNDATLRAGNLSWFDTLWEKAKSYIQIERTDQIKTIVSSPSTKDVTLKTIDQAIALIEKHHFDHVIKTIKEIDVTARPIFEQWIIDAETRLVVEKKIDVLQKHITPLLVQRFESKVS